MTRETRRRKLENKQADLSKKIETACKKRQDLENKIEAYRQEHAAIQAELAKVEARRCPDAFWRALFGKFSASREEAGQPWPHPQAVTDL